MQTIKVATSYVDESVFRKMGDLIVSDYPIEGFKGTRTVAKLQEGRTYNFVTKVVNDGTNYKAVFVVSGNRVTREFNADGENQTFSITLGSGEDGLYINNSENVGVIVSYNQEADFDPKPADFSPTKPFRFWCQTVLPLVYDDSLSYYELLSKVVSYLNSLINDVTNVENIYTNLTNAYTQLEAYVNTYFDNLDVSEAIDAKLDEMVLHGDFDALVAEALSRINYTAIINAEVDEQLPSVVDTKLGTVVGNQIGDVVGNQIGDVVENQIGGAVASQIGDVVENQIGDVVENQIGSVVENQIDGVVSEQIGGAVGSQIGDAVGEQIGAEVGEQIEPVVASKLPREVNNQIYPVVNSWLVRNFTNPPVDKTLTIENAAADAKVTGDALRELQSITIQGMEKKEVNLDEELIRYDDTYFTKVGSSIYIAQTGNITNCACYRNLVGGTTYKIKLNADFSDTSGYENVKAGWFMSDIALPADGNRLLGTIIAPLEDYIGQYPNGDYYISVPYSANGIVFNSLNSTLCGLSIVTMEFEKSEDAVAPAEIESFQNQSLVPNEILWNSTFDANGDIVTNTNYCVVKYTLPTIEGNSQDIDFDVAGLNLQMAIQTRDDNGILRSYNFRNLGQGVIKYEGTITIPSTAKYVWITTILNPYGCVRKRGYNGYVWKGFESIVDEPNVPNYDNNFKIVILDDAPTEVLTGWMYFVVDPSTQKVTDIYCGE